VKAIEEHIDRSRQRVVEVLIDVAPDRGKSANLGL
jgi:hypothetical protein